MYLLTVGRERREKGGGNGLDSAAQEVRGRGMARDGVAKDGSECAFEVGVAIVSLLLMLSCILQQDTGRTPDDDPLLPNHY